MSAVFFLSAVSSEFHHKNPERPMSFESYRDVLTRSLRRQIPGCEVIVQEELKQGYGDLLQTLDDEVRASTVVVHLIGDMAGAEPEAEELRRLRERHPDFLSHEPVLKAATAEADGISYTQWEAYLAFHHRRPRLVFSAEADAPRSPRRQFSAVALASQQAHFQRLRQIGEHYQTCYSQSDLAVKTVVAVERHGLNPTQPTTPPNADKVAAAEQARSEIVAAFVANLRKSVKTAFTEYDPAGIDAYLKALDPIVAQFGLTRQFVLNLIAEERDARRKATEDDPSPENLYDLAFAELALGHYHDAMVAVRQSIEQETRLMSADPDRHDDHRDRVLSGHLLWKDAAEYAGQRAEARRALESGARLLDRDREPILWADFHEQIASHHIDFARYELAQEILDEVIDVREEHQPEPSSALAHTLLNWGKILKAQGKWQGMVSVAARAERMYAAISPPDAEGISASLNEQAVGLCNQGKVREAGPLLRRAVRLEEDAAGPDSPALLFRYSNLANVEGQLGNLSEALRLHANAVRLGERHFPNHPFLAGAYALMADYETARVNTAEARRLLLKALTIEEGYHGPEHPNVAQLLWQLALVEAVDGSNAAYAELIRRAHRILLNAFGPEHPDTKKMSALLSGNVPAFHNTTT